MAFAKEVDIRSRQEMQKFLVEHFRYDTMRSWNRSTSYACNMKIHNLDILAETKSKLYGMLDCPEVYERIIDLINDFNTEHDFKWQAAFNGRSNGYLVLYQGGSRESGYKSFCQFCGQNNYSSVSETGNMCGKCHRPGRINYVKPRRESFVYYGRSTDMNEDFEDWSTNDLRARVEVVMEFDRLADMIVEEAKYIAENYLVREEEYSELKTRKVLKFVGSCLS